MNDYNCSNKNKAKCVFWRYFDKILLSSCKYRVKTLLSMLKAIQMVNIVKYLVQSILRSRAEKKNVAERRSFNPYFVLISQWHTDSNLSPFV